MLEALSNKPFLVAIVAGACAQFVKVVAFLIAERKINYRRFVQTDGAPNMHSAAFSALTVAVGMHDGFHSVEFALALCITAIVFVDTMNVKNATSRQKEAILLLMDRMRKKSLVLAGNNQRVSYTPADVFTGMALGVVLALLMV